jgi:hypothetical protein
MASSGVGHVVAIGSAHTSAEMVISWAAPARKRAARSQGQLGGAGTGAGAEEAVACGVIVPDARGLLGPCMGTVWHLAVSAALC